MVKLNSRTRGQASFFDGVLFMLTVVFSISLIFVTLNNYGVAQDRVLRTSYLANYLQSTSKALYYIDVSTLQDVQSYCEDRDMTPQGPDSDFYYCKEGMPNPPGKYHMDCSTLKNYSGHVTVADLLKKDADPSDKDVMGDEGKGAVDDKFGTSSQAGRTALRCAMKEIMKPFTFSGYRYITEIADSADLTKDVVKHAKDQKYASDYMFSAEFQRLPELRKQTFDCGWANSSQVLVIRTPFKILLLTKNDAGSDMFASLNYVLRTCLWPSSDVLKQES